MNKVTKKTGIVVAVVFGAMLSAGSARAQYGMAGCGLGSLVFGNDNSVMMQVLAATTNNILFPQTFAITSGTSNCVAGGAVAANREQIAFAEVNFQDLKRNMAMGGGEYLGSFATLLGCEESAKAELGKMTQEQFEVIFPSSNTTPVEMLHTVKAQIAASPALQGGCSDERAIARAEGRAVQLARN